MSLSKLPAAPANADRLQPGHRLRDPWWGEWFLGSVRDLGRAPSMGLCATGSMAEFRALSLAEERLQLVARQLQVGRVDRVAPVDGTLLATVQQ